MAFDLLFKKKSGRDWSMPEARARQLTTVPPVAVPPTPTAITEADVKSLANPGGFTVRPKGRGTVVTKKFLF
jgi:hypothetical protein